MGNDSDTDTVGSQEYGPPPPHLINVSPLESFLKTFTSQVGSDIASLQESMRFLHGSEKTLQKTVRNIQQFLLETLPQFEKADADLLQSPGSLSSAVQPGAIAERKTDRVLARGEAERIHWLPNSTGMNRSTKEQRSTSSALKHTVSRSDNRASVPISSPDETPKEAPAGVDRWGGNESSPQQDDQEAPLLLLAQKPPEPSCPFSDTGTWSMIDDYVSDADGSTFEKKQLSEDRQAEHKNLVAGFYPELGEREDHWRHSVVAQVKSLTDANRELQKNLEAQKLKVDHLEALCRSMQAQSSRTTEELSSFQKQCVALRDMFGISEVPQGDEEEGGISLPGNESTSMEVNFANSPILLSIRQNILKDLGERQAHAAEMFRSDLSAATHELKEEIKKFITEDKVISIAEKSSKEEMRKLEEEYSRRVAHIEENYIPRGEFVATMKTKADAYLITQMRAVTPDTTQLERRVFQKIDELEERLAYYEAERSELRSIILSLLKVEGASEAQATLGMRPFPPFQARAVVYSPKEAAERASAGGKALPTFAQESVAEEYGVLPESMTNKPLYRVVSDEVKQDVFVSHAGSGRPPSKLYPAKPSATGRAAGHRSPEAPPQRVVSSSPRKNKQSSAQGGKVEKHEGEGEQKAMIGLTRNQEAYARFVTQDFNRHQVENLPPVSYDSRNFKT